MPYPQRGGIGGGGGAGFQLFIQSDNSQGIYADAAARNAIFMQPIRVKLIDLLK